MLVLLGLALLGLILFIAGVADANDKQKDELTSVPTGVFVFLTLLRSSATLLEVLICPLLSLYIFLCQLSFIDYVALLLYDRSNLI